MKNHIPFIFAAFVVVIAAALYFSQKPEEKPVPISEASLSSTTPPGLNDAAPISAPKPSASGATGIGVTQQTVLKVYDNPEWDITFRYLPTDTFTSVADEEGKAEQVALSNEEGTVLVSKDTSIAEPALLKYTPSTRVIAGQSVEVRTYMKPNEKYAYYLFFTLRAGKEEYHFSLKSYGESREHTDAFIKRIAVK